MRVFAKKTLCLLTLFTHYDKVLLIIDAKIRSNYLWQK